MPLSFYITYAHLQAEDRIKRKKIKTGNKYVHE